MTKKILIIFVAIILIFGMFGVQATSKGENIRMIIMPTEKLIEAYQENDIGYNEWKYIEINQYKVDGIDLFKNGTEKEDVNTVTVGDKVFNTTIMGIIKAYKDNKIVELKTLSPSDAYIATKLALDYVQNVYTGKMADDLENYYRVGNDLTGEPKNRANNIIVAAKKLAKLGYANTDMYITRLGLFNSGIFAIDEEDDNYYSSTLNYTVSKGSLKKADIIISYPKDVECEVEEIGLDEEYEHELENSYKFKVKTLRKDIEEPFTIYVHVDISYYEDCFTYGNDNSNYYIVHSMENKIQGFDTSIYVQEMKAKEQEEGNDSNKGENLGEGENPDEGENLDKGGNPEEGEDTDKKENPNEGENLDKGENPDEGENLEKGDNSEEEENQKGEENPEKAEKPKVEVVVDEEKEPDNGGSQKDIISIVKPDIGKAPAPNEENTEDNR